MVLELANLAASSDTRVLNVGSSSEFSLDSLSGTGDICELPHPGEAIYGAEIPIETVSVEELFHTMSSAVTMCRSSFLNPVKLEPFGRKDIVAGLWMMLLGVLQAGIYWSFTLVNEPRTLPSNISLKASSTLEAELQVNGTFFCSSNATLPSISSDSNNPVLNITRSFTFYEIATCLGWINEHFSAQIFKVISLGLRYSLTAVTFYWAAMNIGKYKWKRRTMTFTSMWLVSIFLYAIATIVDGMIENRPVFIAINLLLNPLYSGKILKKFFGIQWLLACRWLVAWLGCMVIVYFTALIPGYFGSSVAQVIQVWLPLMLTVLDIFLCKVITKCFDGYRYNKKGQALLILVYIWHMEVVRFDCFISLFLQWLDNKVPFQDVFFNAFFSILGEIWTHSGIRELLGCWIQLKYESRILRSDFPEIRMIYSSARSVLELVIPGVGFSTLCFIELSRDYIMVPKDEIYTQMYFFTSAKLYKKMFLIIMLGYYSVEVISLIMCSAVKKVTHYEQKSVLGTLEWHSIFKLGFGVILLDDCRFITKLWCAINDLN